MFDTTIATGKAFPTMTTDENGAKPLQSLIFNKNGSSDNNNKPTLKVLDQLLLPGEKKYIDVATIQDAWTVIRDMNVRGTQY